MLRKTQETREQEAIYEVGMCHLVAGKEFSPAKFGFVCSKAEAESLVKRKWTLEHANNAHTWSLDRESCKPTLAFAGQILKSSREALAATSHRPSFPLSQPMNRPYGGGRARYTVAVPTVVPGSPLVTSCK